MAVLRGSHGSHVTLLTADLFVRCFWKMFSLLARAQDRHFKEVLKRRKKYRQMLRDHKPAEEERRRVSSFLLSECDDMVVHHA